MVLQVLRTWLIESPTPFLDISKLEYPTYGRAPVGHITADSRTIAKSYLWISKLHFGVVLEQSHPPEALTSANVPCSPVHLSLVDHEEINLWDWVWSWPAPLDLACLMKLPRPPNVADTEYWESHAMISALNIEMKDGDCHDDRSPR